MNFELDDKNKKILSISKIVIFTVFILGSLYFTYRLIFSSEYFTYSFKNTNSLKNTITDVEVSGSSASFFTSTPQDFSEIKVEIELDKKSSPIEGSSVGIKKSFKSFFYPELSGSAQLSATKENLLSSSADSIFIVREREKNPFDSPATFEGLGYKWDNIEKEKIDLSEYEKESLLNISSAHPDGTILSTDDGTYYLIKGKTKQKVDPSLSPQIKDFKNNIYVTVEGLKIKENCQLKNKQLFRKKYDCTAPIGKISNFPGKDYRFEISGLSDGVKLKEINIEFKKTPNKNNLSLFLADIKKKVLARFSGEKL